MNGVVNSYDYTRGVWERIPARPEMTSAAHVVWFALGLLTCGLGWLGWAAHAVVTDSAQRYWDRTYGERWIQ
jgi:hypothetical protein